MMITLIDEDEKKEGKNRSKKKKKTEEEGWDSSQHNFSRHWTKLPKRSTAQFTQRPTPPELLTDALTRGRGCTAGGEGVIPQCHQGRGKYVSMNDTLHCWWCFACRVKRHERHSLVMGRTMHRSFPRTDQTHNHSLLFQPECKQNW